MEYVIGIDVGTSSVRGALVNKEGKILRMENENITTWNSKPNFYHQSSDEIWFACCEVIKKLTENIHPKKVKGLGFDATCSLVIIDKHGKPQSSEPDGNAKENVILWMDHRAKEETNDINESRHPVLDYVGGNISIELTIPKLLWLKRNNTPYWQSIGHFFLLPDFLTWRTTGQTTRSLCSVVCGCNYESSPDNAHCGWVKSYLEAIGLLDLVESDWEKIGRDIIKPGELCGRLDARAACETGLLPGTPVSASLIDAHAGALGLLGCTYTESTKMTVTSCLALICGTSTCLMYQSAQKISVPGVWGPYFNVLLPNLWLLIGGQSVSGKLIDHIVENHPAAECIRKKNGNRRIVDYLNDRLSEMAKKADWATSFDELTHDLHVYPDFHGNRSPLADADLRGMILGLTLEQDEDNLALLYLATIQALAYSSKSTIEELQRRSVESNGINSVLISGGLSKNEVYVQTLANVIGLPVFIPKEPESVLLGSAILAATAAGLHPDLLTATMKMAGPARKVSADLRGRIRKFHEKKYMAFKELLECQKKIRALMKPYHGADKKVVFT